MKLREFWNDSLATRSGRLLTFFLLYVSEGIPLGFTGTVIATHMRRDGVDPAAIGLYVGSLYFPWAFKWALGPIVDTITSVRFGRRRTWIVGAQLGMMATLLVAMPIDFSGAIGLFTGLIIIHNICSAAQDVAIDALAVQVLPADERGAANGFMFAGQSIGQAVGGSGVLMISSAMPFKTTFLLVTAALGIILVAVSWRLREPVQVPVWDAVKNGMAPLVRVWRDVSAFIRAAYGAFTGTRAAKLGLLFAVLPLGSYALVLSLQSNLAVELGLDDAKIGQLGFISSVMSAAGCVIGGYLSDRFGRRRMIALFVTLTAIPTIWVGITMYNVGHIMPVDVAHGGALLDTHVVNTFWTMCILFNFANGLTYGSSTALYMDITTPAVAATQFTAYMALNNLVTTYTASWQGLAITHFGYPTTLWLDAAAGLLCIFVLPWLGVSRAERPPGRAAVATT